MRPLQRSAVGIPPVLFLLLSGLPFPAAAQPRADPAITRASAELLEVIDASSVHRDRFDLARLRAEIERVRAQAVSPSAYHDEVPRLLAMTGDHHARFYRPEEAWLLAEGSTLSFGVAIGLPESLVWRVEEGGPAAAAGLRPGDRILRIDGMNPVPDWTGRQARLDGDRVVLTVAGVHGLEQEIVLDRRPVRYRSMPSGEPVGERVGRLVVPAFLGRGEPGEPAYARRLHDHVHELAERGVCGWIVDLRGNAGGNVWQMLAGLAPLLGAGELGAFVSRTGRSRWAIDSLGPTLDGREPVRLRWRSDPALLQQPVAVLTDRVTSSAGEITAIAFRGRPNTRAFGEATRGVPTASDGFALSDGSVVLVSVAWVVDRTGERHSGPLLPDEEVVAGPRNDAPHRRAVEWLRGRLGCAPGS